MPATHVDGAEPTPRRRVRALRKAATLAPLLLTACQASLLDPQGPVGRSELTILGDSLAIMLAIVIPTMVATLAFAWWYRASNTRAKHLPDFAYSGQLELIVWAIPLLTIMLLGGVTWVSSHDLDPAKPLVSDRKTLDVQVVSLDWKWLFLYPEQHVASVNELTIPVGVPVHFTLTSASVMNAFFIPQLGSMIYTMNGMSTDLNLIADKPQTLAGLSSHYSGDGFSDMHFAVHVLPPDAFATWVHQTAATGPTLDEKAYAELSKQSIKVAPHTYRSFTPDLFQNIVHQVLPPGPGPVEEPSPGASQRAEK